MGKHINFRHFPNVLAHPGTLKGWWLWVKKTKLKYTRLSKISVTFKTQDGDNSESLNKLILNKIIVPCDMYRSHPS